jgi:4-hydroxy-3-polyprenylbenzoate decarboxylase
MMEAVRDLERSGQLVRISEEVDPYLEMAEVHRRVFEAQGPALFFERVKGSPFPAVSNIYGTIARTEYLFRETKRKVQRVISLKADPSLALRRPLFALGALPTALNGLPVRSRWSKPILHGQTKIEELPRIVSWPDDGGAFVTAPQVATLPPGSRKAMHSNIGMYRIQLTGNDYELNREVGLHYQLHRGIGVHHAMYNETDEDFRATIFVGGPPSHAFAAIMPLPEGLTEMTFAGMLAGRRFRYTWEDGYLLSSDADFCITGKIHKKRKKPEGPFGDHLGYYSLQHDFPVMEVDRVYHRKDAVWHFTVVGRPPQEDSSFGYLIHELVKEMAAVEFPGLVDVHAVDEAGVHPLLLAVGRERYMPFREPRPEEILTIANRLLGSGQTSLAKFLIIAAQETGVSLSAQDYPAFFRHFLSRVDWRRDLHFQTKTTIDTLDYSGTGWNQGSKVVMACHGPILRTLEKQLPDNKRLPDGFETAHFIEDGILCLSASAFGDYERETQRVEAFCEALETWDLSRVPLIVLCDDPDFTAKSWPNFLWVTFTRANPSHDLYGVGAFQHFKHWGCTGPLVIDARTKPHHAPPLIPDPATVKKADRLFQKGGPLARFG